jgi:heme/copper-type cytochrome/quinol oxidase subunit 3
MTAPPVLTNPEQQRKDAEHLKLLSIFHFILGGLALVGILFLVFHYLMMSAFMSPEFWKSQKNGPAPPPELIKMVTVFYFIGGFFLVLGSVLNLLSALFLRQRRQRVFSMVIAGLNCVQVPFGTALGIFTILILSRDSVRGVYEAPPV